MPWTMKTLFSSDVSLSFVPNPRGTLEQPYGKHGRSSDLPPRRERLPENSTFNT